MNPDEPARRPAGIRPLSGTARILGSGSRLLRRAWAPAAGRATAGASAVVLAYHDIVPDRTAPQRYAVRTSTFRRQIDVAVSLGLRFVTLAELSRRLDAAAPADPGRSVAGLAAIVFDDGLVGVHETAAPLLADAAIPWTLLPVTERLGVVPGWWPGARRTMTRSEIDEVLAAGATLAGHTATHPSLPDIPRGIALDELRRSRDTLSEWAGGEVVDLCYPYGHQDESTRGLARAAGYSSGYTFTNGRCHPTGEPFARPRLAMHEGMGWASWPATLLRPRATWPAVVDLREGHR